MFATIVRVPGRLCMVTLRDGRTERTVELSARTIFEAAVLGLRRFRAASTKVTVVVSCEGAVNQIGAQELRQWLSAVGRSQREQVLKTRLREALWLPTNPWPAPSHVEEMRGNGGHDETRTRDLRRDRPAF